MTGPLTERNIFKCINDVIPIVGGFGRFQKLLISCFCIMIIPSTCSILIMYFGALNPSWRCSANSSRCLQNGTFPSENKERCRMHRSDWEFTESHTYSIITQFDIYCDNEWMIYLTTSIFFIGWAFGAVFLGWLSDNYGRKIVIFPSFLLIMFVGFLAAFSPNVTFLIVCRFIIGFCIPGSAIQSLVLISEFVTTKYRPHSIILIWFSFSSTLCLLALKAYYIREWKLLFIVCTAPYIFIMAFYKFIPESIRWLHLHGKLNDLLEVFHRMEYWNKKTISSVRFTILPLEIQNGKNKSSPVDLFKSKGMAIKTLVQGNAWLVNGMVYYGLSLAAGDLGGSLYRNFAILSAVEVPALILMVFLCDRIGRKRTTSGSMAIGSIACLAVAFIPSTGDFKLFRITLGILGKCCITISFSAIYTWSLEIYDTNIRAEGIGFLQVTSRIGAASSPWIAKGLKSLHRVAPFIVMGVLSLIASITLLVLPETKGKPIRDIDEKGLEEENEEEVGIMMSTVDSK